MRRLGALYSTIVFATLVATGCGRGNAGGAGGPVVPGDQSRIQNSVEMVRNDNRHVWGFWEINISEDRQVVEIMPARMEQMHLNVVRLLEVTPCKDCLIVGNIKLVEPNVLEADLTLKHPFPGLTKYTGFDVRGIFISEANYTFPVSGREIAWGDGILMMLNPDGYTQLFNPTEYPPTTPAALGYIEGKYATGGDLSATLNPFLAYRRDAPRRMFEAGGSETRTARIYAPSGPIHFGYAVDACWQLVPHEIVDPLVDFPPDANCLEAYRMDVLIGAGLHSEPGSEVPIRVEIYDHQGQETVSTVAIEAPDLFAGELPLTFYAVSSNGAFLFTGTLPNDLGAPDGEYPLLLTATDTGSDPHFGTINAWQVSCVTVGALKGWARTWGGEGYDEGDAVAVYGSDIIYVTGHFHGTVDFDPGPGVDEHVPNGDEHAGFLSRFNSSGDFIWARTWGGSGGVNNNGVTVDDSGNVYVTGLFYGAVDFDPGPGVDEHTSNGVGDIHLTKFDSDGDFVWARTWGGDNIAGDPDIGYEVAVDDSGGIYVAGIFQGPADLDPGPGVDEHTSDGTAVFLSKFDSNGDFIWARTWECVMRDNVGGIAVDGSGAIYVTGYFYYTQDFDPGPGIDNHTPVDGHDAFLSSFDLDGNYNWARTWGGPNDEYGCGVTVDSLKNIYVAGQFQNTADFDPGPGVDERTSCGGDDIFLSKFKPAGEFMWALTWGGLANDGAHGVSVDSLDDVLVTGDFWGTADLDPGQGTDNRTSNGKEDAYLIKLDSEGNYLWARTWGSSSVDKGNKVVTDGSGNSYVCGRFVGEVDFDPGLGIDNHFSNGGADAFLSKFPPDGNW
jgi:hypothetical protein